jgi:hypothetical protein
MVGQQIKELSVRQDGQAFGSNITNLNAKPCLDTAGRVRHFRKNGIFVLCPWSEGYKW